MAQESPGASLSVPLALPNLEAFERSVYGRARVDRVAENDKALGAMLSCLALLGEGRPFEGRGRLTQVDLTRFCAAIVSLFTDPGFKLTLDGFLMACSRRSVLEACFMGSAFRSSDFVFETLTEDTENLNKYLVLYGLNSPTDLDLEAVFRKDPAGTIALYLSYIAHGQVFTEAGDARREKLLKLTHVFEGASVPEYLISAIAGAYMHCSYAHGDEKHAPKYAFHKIMGPLMGEIPPSAVVSRDRPTLLVVFEWWNSKHAMYRCYIQSIKQLRRDFRLVGMVRKGGSDPESLEVFDLVVELDLDTERMQACVAKVREVAPDVIYYPSIGMGIWVIGLASLRLAPVQIMSYGHPATSRSTEIDYGIIESDIHVPGCFSETMITLPSGSIRFVPYAECKVRHQAKRTDVVKVAIAAMQVKVSWPLIRTLQYVMARATKKVELHFFSAVSGVAMEAFCNTIEKLLANTTVYEMAPYQDLMANIAACDVCLFSFPFGGANSTIDAMTLGIPMLAMEGEEPHARTDASLMRRAGLPESLICHTEREYGDRLLSLIDDDERMRVAELVRAVDVEQFFKPDESNAFADAFANIYRVSKLEKAA